MPRRGFEPLPLRPQREALPRRHGGKGLATFWLWYILRQFCLLVIGCESLADFIGFIFSLAIEYSTTLLIESFLRMFLPDFVPRFSMAT